VGGEQRLDHISSKRSSDREVAGCLSLAPQHNDRQFTSSLIEFNCLSQGPNSISHTIHALFTEFHKGTIFPQYFTPNLHCVKNNNFTAPVESTLVSKVLPHNIFITKKTMTFLTNALQYK
jgi:hypothetical protein